MILPNQKIQITIVKKNIEHFRELGYDVNIRDVILVPPEHLTPQSNKKIKVICEYCGKVVERKLQSYFISKRNGGKYACSSRCAYEKNMKTNIEKYGVAHSMQREEVKKKSEQVVLEKYGVKNVFELEEIQEKIKQTNLDKYGAENPFSSEKIKQKIRTTMLNKYGVEYNMQREEMKREHLYGEKNNSYVDGRTGFRDRILSRDGYKCILCGSSDDLHHHHLEAISTNKDLEFVEDNCVTLCSKHHKQFHSEYGNGYNTRKQFEEFKKKFD